MNKIIKESFAASIVLKVANMKKEAEFVLYPYSGGDRIYLQSDKRWIEANIRTGAAKIIKKGVEYANSYKMLFIGHIDFELPAEAVTSIQNHLWNNSGLQGNTVMKYENKELFSDFSL
jgi:hypothetical protein